MLIRLNILNKWQTDMCILCETCTKDEFKQEYNNGNERFYDYCYTREIRNPQLENCTYYENDGSEIDNI